MTHLELANSNTMAILCGITILIVLLQPILFVMLAIKQGKKLEMTSEELKEAARSSAIFSIIPSLPIVVSYLMLVPMLGRYFPWLRLSVVGSAAYETMIADMAARAFGLESMSVENVPLDVFIGILFVVSVAILGGNIFNVFFLKTYDKGVEKIKNKNAAMVPIITGGMFLGMYGSLATPYLVNVTNIPAISAILGAGVAALVLTKASQKVKRLREFSFPVSMLVGMFTSCIVSLSPG